MIKWMATSVLLVASAGRAESVGSYLSHGGRETRGLDFNLGFLSGLPSGLDRAEGRLGARVGLSYEPDPLPLWAIRLPTNLALLYSTKALELGGTLWTFSLLQFQILFHHTVHPGFPWVEPAVFVSPHYTVDLILSGSGGNLAANRSLERKISLDLGAALLINPGMLQARLYYARNVGSQVAPTSLKVSTLGADLLLPLSLKRRNP